MKYIASITCGKNSLAMLIKIIENPDKYPLDEIVLCEVMATSTQSASFELHRQFIEKTIPVIEKMAKVPVKVIFGTVQRFHITDVYLVPIYHTPW